MQLEDRVIAIRQQITELESELTILEQALHLQYVEESGLIGKVARSDRVKAGIVIDDVQFKTWAPQEPQAVSGFRCDIRAHTTIHVTSPGFQIS